MKLKELEKRLKQEPDNFGLRVQVAGLMREAGRSVEAVELYRSVALAYRDQGRTQQAIAVCRSILDIAPDDAACQGLLAMLQGRGTSSRPPLSESPVVVRPSPLPPEKVPNVPSLRPPTKPPASAAPRRSSFDETPLPKPIPYHVSDPTSQPNRVSSGDIDLPASEGAETRPGEEPRRTTTGLAQAARRISGLISDTRGVPQEMDLAAELDTRQRRRIESEELRKIEQPPPTVPIERIDDDDDEDNIKTHGGRNDDLATDRVESLTPPPRGSNTDDLFTPPPRGSEDAITPPPLTGAMPERQTPLPPPPRPSRPPPIVAIPPKTPIPSIAKPRTPQSSNAPLGDSVTKLRPPPPPGPPQPPSRPGMARIPRDSDEELTNPRDVDIDLDEDE